MAWPQEIPKKRGKMNENDVKNGKIYGDELFWTY